MRVSNPGTAADRRAGRGTVMIAVFLLALLCRAGLVSTFDVEESGFGFADESYLEYARNLSTGRGFFMDGVYGEAGPERMYAFRPPLFPLVWGLFYGPTGGSYRPMWYAFAVLSAIGCVVVYRVGLRLFAEAVPAAIGAGLCAVYPPLVFHGVNLMTEPFFIFFLALFMLFLLRCLDTGWKRDAALAGVFVGLATLSRSAVVGFPPLAGLWLLSGGVRGSKTRGRRWALLGCFALAGCLTLAPWWVRNAVVLGAVVPTTTDGGHGFYVANNPKALDDPRGFYMPEDWSFATDGERLDEAAMQRALYQEALSYLSEHPTAWARLVGGRLVKMLRPWPDPRFVSDRDVIIYGVSVLGLLPFILLGLVRAHQAEPERRAKYLLIDLLIVYTLGIHAFFLAMLRYRVPIMPYLLLFAGYGAWQVLVWVGRIRGKRQAARRPATVGDFDRVAAEYDESIPAHVRDHYLQKRVRCLQRLLAAKPQGRFLELGCGTGLLMEALARRGMSVTGVDNSAGMLNVARRRGGDVVQADVTSLPFPDDSFDGVFSVATLHHLADPGRVDRVIGEMVRVARPGGRILIWDHNPLNPYWPVIMGKVPQDSGGERLVPAREVVGALRRRNVAAIRIRRSGFVPDFVPAWLMPAARLAEWLIERAPLLRTFAAHNVVVAEKPREKL